MRSVLFFFFTVCSLLVFPQPDTIQTNKSKPKIGLVLSGGGAKGMAHVGVLKVLEELGIVPDYITGTSMGSIVGGMYAIGYTAGEIEKMLQAQNWNEVLSNEVPLSDVSINEKDHYGHFFAEFPIRGIEVGLPKGMIYGQRIMTLLNHYTLPAYKIDDFTKLPIPFKCVAADITNAEVVVLDTGSMAHSMRASMAIPSVFTPIELAGHYLVDGGLTRNFPVEEVKEMGADIIIGSYTGGILQNKDELNSAFAILKQSAFFMGIFDAEEQAEDVDIYIEPELKEFSAADFNKVDSVINRGVIAAMGQYEKLKKLADSLNLKPGKIQRHRLSMPDTLVVDEITTSGINPEYHEFVLAKIGVRPKEPFTVHELEDGINKIYGTRYFYRVFYSFDYSPDGHLKLIIHGENRATGYLGVSLHYDSEKRAAFMVNIMFRDLLIPSSRLSITGNISESPGLQLDYFKYVGKSRNFTIGFQYNLDAFLVPLYSKGVKRGLYDYNYNGLDFYTRYSVANNSRFSLGHIFETTSLKPDVFIDDSFEKWKINNNQLYFQYEINTLDRRYFSRNGIDLSLRFEYNYDINYEINNQDSTSDIFNSYFGGIKLRFNSFHEIINGINLHTYAHAGVTFGDNYTLVKEYKVGGLFTAYSYLIPFVGFRELEYTDNQVFTGGVGVRVEPFQDFFMEPRVNALISAGYLSEFVNTSLEEKFVLGYGLELGYASLIGPIVASVSSNTYNNKVRAFFNVGYRFRF